MQVKVLLFATLKDRVGQNQLTVRLPGDSSTVADVRDALVALHPALQPNLGTAVSAVNQEFAFAGDPVRDGDEVAFFPPVSGGSMDYPEIFQIATMPIDLDALVAAITIPATGAVCVFSGMVRGETTKQAIVEQTQRLEYEAYEPMAVAKMRQVAIEIRQRFPGVQGIAMVQRVGDLAVGENTVIIACASGHRDQGCFEGARYGIDRLKEIVPVWKKEVRPDGSAWVEGHYTPEAADRGDI